MIAVLSSPHPIRCLAGGIVLGLCGAGIHPASATMPPNPDRGTAAQTCAEAIKRLRIVADGSPLISAAEQTERLQSAIRLIEQKCGEKKLNPKSK